jgi:GH35 family endo-1,4-beta-xylanase
MTKFFSVVSGILLHTTMFAATMHAEGTPAPKVVRFAPYEKAQQASDAPWRKIAQERIEKERKGNLTIEIADGKNQGVEKVEVEVKMTAHAFQFGSAIAAPLLEAAEPDKNAKLARGIFPRWFNAGTVENELKPNFWAKNREPGIAAVKWLSGQGIPVHGHTLIWPAWERSGEAMKYKDDPKALREYLLGHIRDEVGALKGQVASWDVVNEPRRNRDLMNALGDKAMLEWFQEARKADPKARLFINDFGHIENAPPEASDEYEKIIQGLIKQGAPLDGIGLEAHIRQPRSPEQIYEKLERFAKLGKPLRVTEFDFAAENGDAKLTSDYTRDFLTVVFSHPAVEGVTLWGFWEGSHYRPDAALFMQDWTPKPSALAWYELVRKEWWTNASGVTDAKGEFKTRGFLGEYEVTVKVGERTVKKKVTLPKAGVVVKINLDEASE